LGGEPAHPGLININLGSREKNLMLIHFTPRILEYPSNQHSESGFSVFKTELAHIEIPEFNLVLVGGKDVVKRYPYKNKRYAVACRKIGRKAISGILLDVPYRVGEFTTKTYWEIYIIVPEGCKEYKEGICCYDALHTVKYNILDSEFDLASDNIMLWIERKNLNFQNRKPEYTNDIIQMKAWPCYDIFPRERQGYFEDKILDFGMIQKRTEIFKIPTVESERMLKHQKEFDVFKEARLPTMEMVFKVKNK
jgi:hypothetical protein